MDIVQINLACPVVLWYIVRVRSEKPTRRGKMFKSKTIKRAWKIRREVAENIGCNVLEVVWSECIVLAKEFETAVNGACRNGAPVYKAEEWAANVLGVIQFSHDDVECDVECDVNVFELNFGDM